MAMHLVDNNKDRDCRRPGHAWNEEMELSRVLEQSHLPSPNGTQESSRRSECVPEFRRLAKKDGGRMQYLMHLILPLLVSSLLLSISVGCRKKAAAPPPTTVVQTPPALPSTPAPPAITPSIVTSKPPSAEPPPVPKATIAPNSLDLGMKSFRTGDYAKSVQLFEDYLHAGANTENRDVALFHLFLSRRLSGNSNKNTRRAEEALKQIVAEFPNSPYKDSAEYILGLQAQIENLRSENKEKDAKIKQLSDELQKLKEIDLQRRPSRPLY